MRDQNKYMIEHRLNSGEDALDLSIKIWENKLLSVKSGIDTRKIKLGESYCPLCVKYRNARWEYDCGSCPLAVNGFKCTDRGSVYLNVFEKYNSLDPSTGEPYSIDEKIAATRNMLNLLNICKKLETTIPDKTERVVPYTEGEIRKRMERGDNIYDLSIEIWNARRNYIALGGSMDRLPLGSAYCPLCIKFKHADYFGNYRVLCQGCPLYKMNEGCREKHSAYRRVQHIRDCTILPGIIKRHLFVKAIDRMIGTLRAAKCMNE